ncbi:hypothetical protein GRX01_17145 [Halobaculum sp. WSA2]|uniref:Uncharacterized protein n=1 Tax=Halobaculum saliterrae TaxID=2073113 RepID=A0A6B0T940_9EURY|nr:hypothetical protein [Halobaculum saliterrae]MXR43059.1 hypothetical protein [Halobaculum saliterrae]
MGTEPETDVDPRSDSPSRDYPFGLSSRQLFVLVVLVGLIGPGLGVYALEQANLSTVADFVWIVGYGTTVLVVWFIWLRPLDFSGSSAQDTSPATESEQVETESEDHDDAETANAAEEPDQSNTPPNKNTSQSSAPERAETSDST